MFDTKTERFQEWEVPTPWSGPYDVALDKNSEAWTGSMLNDRIARLNPKTGQFVEYLLPQDDQRAPRVRRQLDEPGHLLGRQQPRRFDHQARAARLTVSDVADARLLRRTPPEKEVAPPR